MHHGFQEADYTHHTYFCPSPYKKIRMAHETTNSWDVLEQPWGFLSIFGCYVPTYYYYGSMTDIHCMRCPNTVYRKYFEEKIRGFRGSQIILKIYTLEGSCCSQSPFLRLAASANFLNANYKELAHPPIFSYSKYLRYTVMYTSKIP